MRQSIFALVFVVALPGMAGAVGPFPGGGPGRVTATYSPPAVAGRRMTGPGRSDGPLSVRFPEVQVVVDSGFAHDRGMMSWVKSVSVAGQAVKTPYGLQELVAHRKGWTRTGGARPEVALTVFQQYLTDWFAVIPHSERMTVATLPKHLKSVFEMARLPAYHPPKYELQALKDGDHVVVHRYFKTWDGGHHGDQASYHVEAFRVSNGAAFKLETPNGPPRLKRK